MPDSNGYILALDQGTTSSRAIVFNRSGMAIGMSQIPFKQYYPRPGWVEHDPEEIWSTQIAAAREAQEKAQITAEQVRAIGITNQRETTILWERATGKPVGRAIVWQCRRSAGICDQLKAAGAQEGVRAKTGLVLDPYFSGSKLSWLFREDPYLHERAARGEILFGTVDSWLLWRLTGAHLTDATNASRTLLYDIRKGAWDPDLLELFNVPAAVLPEVRPSSGDFGMTLKGHFGREIPVRGCAGDQQAALFGHACFSPGAVKNTYGTGCFTLMNTGAEAVASKKGLLTTIAWDLGVAGGGGRSFALEGSVFIGGAVIQWLRDELGIISEAAESESLARSVPDSGGVYLVPAFVGLGAPHWDSGVRGSVFGLTRGSGRAQIARAALEAIAYQSKDLIDAMEEDSGQCIRSLKADGGAAANSFLMQFQADILGRPVALPEVNEVTALGAAYLAGLSCGYWEGLEDVERNWRMRREFLPLMGAAKREELMGGWRAAVAAARGFSPGAA